VNELDVWPRRSLITLIGTPAAQRGVSVAWIVEADAEQACRLDPPLKRSGEPLRVDWRPVLAGEDQT
jgi:hypothetical protein